MERYIPSAIILGVKRSGTNFTHDILSYAYDSAVQEPLGLHNEGPMSFVRNPLDPWRYSSAQHVSLEYGHTALKEDPYHRQLALYYAIAAQEIVRNANDVNKISVFYEEMTERPFEVFQNLCTFLELPWCDGLRNAVVEHTAITGKDSTHGTFRNRADIHSYRDALTDMEIADIGSIFEEFSIRLEKLSSNAIAASVMKKSESKNKEQQCKVEQRERVEVAEEIQRQAVEIGIDETKILSVGKYLVSNEQYTQFLIWLQQNSIPIAVNGKPLFYNDRPQTKIHIKDDGIFINEGFANHPVVFVNWMAAAIYCKWINGRLPTSTEWNTIFNNRVSETNDDANIQQTYGDTTPVDFSPPDSRGIYDTFGNAGVWVDSILGVANLEAERRGIGWSHALSYNLAEHKRPYWFGSAAVGIRPVFDKLAVQRTDEEIAGEIRGLVDFLTGSYHQDIQAANYQILLMIRRL